MTEQSGRGAKVFLTISVIILAVTILFTASYALFLSPVTKLAGRTAEAADPVEQDGPSAAGEQSGSSAQDTAGDMPASGSAKPDMTTTPDWIEAERLLDELAETAPETAAEPPSEGGHKLEPRPTPEPSEQIENPFVDVAESDYFYQPAVWAARNGILFGDTLRPGDSCARAQAMTFLWRQAGSPEPLLKVCPFLDVAEEDYFYRPVLWAFENGLISAPTDGKFNPDNTVTRAQVMLFLYRMEKGSADGLENPYDDVPADSYYHDAALWAYDRGIVLLGDARTFDADAPCTRGQFITFLYRCFAE